MAVTVTKADSRMIPDPSTGVYELKTIYQLLVDSESDLTDAPTDACPGSLAYTADGQNWWMMANDGDWTEYGTVPSGS